MNVDQPAQQLGWPTRVLATRTALGLSQEQFAALLGGTTGRTVSRWETGESEPRGLSRSALEKLEKRAQKGIGQGRDDRYAGRT